MKSLAYSNRQALLFLLLASGSLALLLAGSVPLPADWIALAPAVSLFVLLVLFASYYSIPLVLTRVSLAHMMMASALLVLGIYPAAWVALVAAVLYDSTRLFRRPARILVATMSQNLVLQTASVLAAGAFFRALGGRFPLVRFSSDQIIPILVALLVYALINNGIFAIFSAVRGLSPLQVYRQEGWAVIMVETSSLIFAPLVAVVFTQLGLIFFALFVLALAVVIIIVNRLAAALAALERRARILGTLNAVGQALAANLRLDDLLAAVQAQVGELMDASNLYVALYNAAADEIHFPLAIQRGEVIHLSSRRASDGLTEYVIRNRQPLLLLGDVVNEARKLGVQVIGEPSAAWLGVPLLSGDQILGIIAVQSPDDPAAYDEQDQETLVTIAAQTSVAIVNARLYERTDLALEKRVRELSAVLNASRDGILLLDPAGHILMANPALAEWVDLPISDWYGTSVFDQSLSEGRSLLESLGYTTEDFRAALQQAEREPGAFLTAFLDQQLPRPRSFARALTAVRAEQETVLGWLVLLRDISEERKLAQMREDLTSMIIHDLRSPLASIISGAEMLQMSSDPVGESDRELMEIIESSGRKMLEMVHSLLEISRLETGQMPVLMETVQVPPIVEGVIAQLGPIAQPADLDLVLDCPPGLPLLETDPEKLGRILRNLLDNAINFTPPGGQVRVWAKAGASELIIGVSDTGPGVPADELPHLFEKFRQVRGQPGRNKGSGLGLAFCHLAVNALGGRIWVESEPGKGSTFALALPVVRDGEAVDG